MCMCVCAHVQACAYVCLQLLMLLSFPPGEQKPNTATEYVAAHLSKIHGLDWHPDNEFIFATSSQDNSVRVRWTDAPEHITLGFARRNWRGGGACLANLLWLFSGVGGHLSRLVLTNQGEVSLPCVTSLAAVQYEFGSVLLVSPYSSGITASPGSISTSCPAKCRCGRPGTR